jgi:hypothetical protein
MDSSIQQIESVYINELQFNALQRAEPFSLYGGSNQPLTYVTPEISTLTCGNKPEHGPRAISSNLRALIPNFDLYNLAEYLRLGTFAGCLTDEWQDLNQYCDDDPANPQAPPTCYWVGLHKAILTIYFDSVPLLRQTVDGGYQTMPIHIPDIWTLSSWTDENGYKVKFDALTTADPLSPEIMAQQAQLFNTTTAKVEARLAEFQQGMYARVLSEMGQGSLRPLTTELAGHTRPTARRQDRRISPCHALWQPTIGGRGTDHALLFPQPHPTDYRRQSSRQPAACARRSG